MKIAQENKIQVTSIEREQHVMIGLLQISFSILKKKKAESFYWTKTIELYQTDKGRVALVQLEMEMDTFAFSYSQFQAWGLLWTILEETWEALGLQEA